MEHLVIKVLGFDVAVPTANVFIDLYCKQLSAGDTLKYMAQVLYLCITCRMSMDVCVCIVVYSVPIVHCPQL